MKTPLRKRSSRQKLINEIDSLIRIQLIKERGDACQICGSTKQSDPLGLFHILPKGRYTRIRFYARNLLLVRWFCCHNKFHHDPYFAKEVVFPRIAKILQEPGWETGLKIANETSQKLTMHHLENIRSYWNLRELKKL